MRYETSFAPRFASDFFSMQGKLEGDKAKVLMRVFGEKTHTSDLPSTLSVLKRSRPEILQADCQNYLGIPFHEEVKDTEVGHLFEHILLGHLVFLSKKSAAFEGETRWDWKKDPVGTFHITVDIDHEVFKRAWSKSITLLNEIFENDKPRL